MVGEAPAHNEARRDLDAPLIARAPVGPPLSARIVPKRAVSEAETRAVSAGRDAGGWSRPELEHPSSPRIFLAGAGDGHRAESEATAGQFKPVRPSRMA